jgi:hypothetical protein
VCENNGRNDPLENAVSLPGHFMRCWTTGAQILDVLDGTGIGDVDMSKVVRADEEGCITGVFGDRLHVNAAWSNPTGAPPCLRLGCVKLVAPRRVWRKAARQRGQCPHMGCNLAALEIGQSLCHGMHVSVD